MKIKSLILILTATSLHSCFTGVEVTPRISERQVNREIGTPSVESKLLTSVAGESPAVWTPGKVFTVTDGKVSVAYLPASVSSTLLPGDTLKYERMDSATTLTGAKMTDLTFLTTDGRRLTHRVETPPETFLASRSVALPFLVDASVIDSVKSILNGLTLWTLTLRRYSLDGKSIAGNKFQKVTVTDVRAGKGEYPVEVILGDEMLYLTVDPQNHSPRRFSNLFSLTDPRKNYRHISDKNWEMITRGQVTNGMTMEECRLALGTPKEIERNATYEALIERWTYENGIYLLFSDGILTRYRN